MTRKSTNNTTNKIKKPIEYKVCSGDCHKSKNIETGFYSAKNKILYPDGKISICKLCLKKAIYNGDGTIDINKFKQILQQMDIPFLYDEYERAINNPNDSVGIYFKNLNSLPQNSGLTWKDSIFEKQTNNKINNKEVIQKNKDLQEDDSDAQKSYSKEWRGHYTQSDIDYLNEYLSSLKNDFKIVTRNHLDYAKKIAKASLAADKAYEQMVAGASGYDKKYKELQAIFDTLSKSAQFSENTRSANDVGLGGFGVTFDKVEQQKWIPKHTPLEKDDYDKLLESFGTIRKSM